jgi:hypothetical protein
MKILVLALYVSGSAYEGGSSRFMRLVADTLASMGHTVTISNQPDAHHDKEYDLIICSHLLQEIQYHPALKVFVSHGILLPEAMTPGADRYISISEEVQTVNREIRGILSEIIPQPIKMGRFAEPVKEIKKILIIRRIYQDDPFKSLSVKYEVRDSDIDTPIENQIAWADLCISLGRGALEAMAQGKPVIVADSRDYFGAKGDGYVNAQNIGKIATCNFSGRAFGYDITPEWLEGEIAKHDPANSRFLYDYVRANHEAGMICQKYLEPIQKDIKLGIGVMVNSVLRLDMVLRQSGIQGDMHYINEPESATKGLNTLLDIMEKEGDDVAILVHQDMYFRQGWLDQVRSQIKLLPDDWMCAGVIGKAMDGAICGKFRDMRIPSPFDTSNLHTFPHMASCVDECVILINLGKHFRFDESYNGFDLYGTLVVLQAWEAGYSAWIIDAPCEHYCMRPFTWHPDDLFVANYKRLYDRFNILKIRIDSTALGLPRNWEPVFNTSASAD